MGLGDLEAAERALGENDGDAALEHLLAAWRDRKTEETAVQIDALSHRLDQARPPVSEDDFHEAWMAAARAATDADVGRLLPGLLREPLGEKLIERVRWMTMRADDPRVARGLVAMIAEPPATSQSIIGKLWGPVFSTIERIGDARGRTELEARLRRPPEKSKFWPQHYRKIEQLLKKLPAAEPAPADERKALVRIAKLVNKLKAAPRTAKKAKPAGDDPLRVVWDEPTSVEARLVCADRLVERGDPRGELILLQHKQLSGTATAADEKKIRELLRMHGERLVPVELMPVLTPKNYGFHLGFLGDCEVVFPSAPGELLEHPGWRTVRELYTDELPMIVHPNLASLVKVGSFDLATLVALGQEKRELKVTSLGTILVGRRPPAQLAQLAKLEAPNLPDVTEVELYHTWEIERDLDGEGGWAWLPDVPLFRRVKTLSLVEEPFPPNVFLFRELRSLERLRMVDWQRRVEIVRDGKKLAATIWLRAPNHGFDYQVQNVGKLAEGLRKEGVADIVCADGLANPTKASAQIAEGAKLRFDASRNLPGYGIQDVRNREIKRMQRLRKARAKR